MRSRFPQHALGQGSVRKAWHTRDGTRPTHTRTHAHTHTPHIHAHTRTHAHTHTRTHAHTSARTRIPTFTHTHTRTHPRAGARTPHHAQTHTHTHTPIHNHRHERPRQHSMCARLLLRMASAKKKWGYATWRQLQYPDSVCPLAGTVVANTIGAQRCTSNPAAKCMAARNTWQLNSGAHM